MTETRQKGEKMKKEGFLKEAVKNRSLFIMLLPAVILIIITAYLPMTGLVLAFKNYRFDLGIWGSEWCGFDNFKYFFNSGTGWLVTRNTIVYNLANLLTSQILSIIVAIIISEMTGRIFKKIVQTVTFLPYFISWIIVGAFVYNIFNYETGVLNTVMAAFGQDKLNVYQMPEVWKWIIMFFNSWKWVGYNSVIYIAAIAGVDQECYEAAAIDGANIFQKIRFITIPSIRSTIIVILLLNVGRILRGDFQMFYQIVGNNGQLFNATDVIDTYVFRSLINSGDVGMTAAATFYQSVLCFIIIVTVNAIVKKIDSDYALF
ncbi:MAG TPA: ABC transporter permease subunit [Candidatus Mediterraneibacter cottocaccae]|nr:ABC transporter permease subunit [Candidatus Mediterraneibacter cottocaccae]